MSAPTKEAKRVEIETLKRKHNALWKKGTALYEQVAAIGKIVLSLRDAIKALEGDDYDDIRLLFCGTFFIEGEDDE